MLLLAVIRDSPGHGYAVIQELRRRSNEALKLPEGTVYPALHRLESRGLLRSEWSFESNRRRCVYSLTAAGRSALMQEQRAWANFVHAVEGVLAT